MKKPGNEELLHQLNILQNWCGSYLDECPRNQGSYRGGVLRGIYKPLRDGIVFYSSGWGWRLRKNWRQVIAHKREELQANHERLVAWFKGDNASNNGLQSDGAYCAAGVELWMLPKGQTVCSVCGKPPRR